MAPTPLQSAAPLILLMLATSCGGADKHSVAEETAKLEIATVADPGETEAPPAPRSIRDRAPAQIRGLYLNAYAAGSRTRLPSLIAIADSTEINTFVIDVKDERGIRFPASDTFLDGFAQPDEVTIRDLSTLVDTLHEHDIHAIARVVVFNDPILSRARPEWSIRQPNGEIWRDRSGHSWVSPWDERVWDYNIRIAEHAARAGFDEIQFDYVRFPEQFRSLPAQVHPHARGERSDAIATFLGQARERLHPLEVIVTADVFGLSPSTYDDVGIGQQWETIAASVDHVLPMMYPSHYLPTHLPNVARPNAMPYETVFKSAGMARMRNDRMQEDGIDVARVVVWLQAFQAPWLRDGVVYSPEQVRMQKRAVYDVGFDDWILWHPGSRYEPMLAALDPATTSLAASTYTPPDDVATTVERFEVQGVRAARERAGASMRTGGSGQRELPDAGQHRHANGSDTGRTAPGMTRMGAGGR